MKFNWIKKAPDAKKAKGNCGQVPIPDSWEQAVKEAEYRRRALRKLPPLRDIA